MLMSSMLNERTEIVFILNNVEDFQVLLSGIEPSMEVHVLDAAHDGLAQMAQILAGRHGIDAIQIISHGSTGAIQLGAMTLNMQNLPERAADLAIVSAALNENADILLYGCNVSTGSDGAAFISALAQSTHADVAASSNLTGAAAYGGDWVLESASGHIETASLQFAGYQQVLTPPVVVSTPDLVSGSDSGVSSSDNLTNRTTPNFKGTASANATVNLYESDGTTLLGSTTANGSGNWTITSSVLSEGVHRVKATASDGFGHVSALSAYLQVTIDSTAPATSPDAPSLDSGTDSGVSNVDGITSNSGPCFLGTGADANSWVNVYADGTLLGTTLSDGSGNYTYSATYLADGVHLVTAKNVDNAGNIGGPSGAFSFTIDSETPTTTISTIVFSADHGISSTDFITNEAIQTISGTTNAVLVASEIVEVSLDNGGNWTTATTSVGSNAFSLAGQALAASDTLKVRVSDLAGNASLGASQAYVLDIGAPTTTVATVALSDDTGASSTDFITKTPIQTISGTTSANLITGEAVQVSLDNGSTWALATSSSGTSTWSLAGQTLLASNTLKVRVTDVAGNTSTPASYAYVLDATAPTVSSVNSSSADATYKPGDSVSVQVNFSEAVIVTGTPQLTLETGSTDRVINYASGSGSSTLTFTYTVQAGDLSADLDYQSTTALALHGGTIGDAVDNAASLTLFAPGAANSLGSNKSLVIETRPQITSSAYDASTGVLSGTAVNLSTSDVIQASKFTFVGEGGASYTLVGTPDGLASSGSAFSITLDATDKAAVNQFMNKAGTSSTIGTSFNLAAADDWDNNVTANDTSDASTPVTVANVAAPSITSATYDAATGLLAVTGSNFVSYSGAGNDIDVSKLSLLAEGSSVTLTTSSNVEITSASAFTVLLSATDQAALDMVFNKAGTSSTGATTYILAAADHWAVGADATVNVADLTGNGVTVAHPLTPAISSASYDSATNTLVVTGSGFLKLDGASNDIIANKLSITGEGGASYTLTNSSNVDISSGTSFTLLLSDADKLGVAQLVNRDGTASTGATTYNLAAAEDWAGGADGTLVLADLTGNGVTVSNLAVPAISASTYDAGTGRLVVSGSGFLHLGGGANDIVANKLSLTGGTGASYTLTDTANVDIDSASAFTLTLSATDKAGVNLLLNQSGTASLSATIYNLAAGEDWAAGADAAVLVADLSGNGVTATVPVPSPEPPVTAPIVTGSVDGAITQTQQAVDPTTGLTHIAVSVPITPPGRADDPASAHPGLADIPLGVGNGSGANAVNADLVVSLPSGTGLDSDGSSGLLNSAQALHDLISRIEGKTSGGSPVQTQMTGQGADFLSELPASTLLATKTLVPTIAPGTLLTQAIIISGSSTTPAPGAAPNATAIGLVIDASHLPANAVLQLDNVDFAAIIGAATLRGGDGRNYVIGDDAAQNILLGADDDVLFGGGGDDIVGSAGGNDRIDGGSGNDVLFGGIGNDSLVGGTGNDVLQGGRSDVGRWDFYLDAGGHVVALHNTALANPAATEVLAKADLNLTVGTLGFASADPARLQSLSLLYHAAFERTPDLAGLSFWAQSGATLAQVASGFLRSDEASTGLGRLGNADFVHQVYQNALGHAGSAGDTAAAVAQLDAAPDLAAARTMVFENIALSSDHRALWQSASGVTLGGKLLASEQGWIVGGGDDRLDGGAGNDTLVGGDGSDTIVYAGQRVNYKIALLATGEITVTDRANGDVDQISQIEKGAFSDGTVDLGFTQATQPVLRPVGQMYQAVLGRAADLVGINYWIGHYQDTVTLAARFVDCAEFKSRFGVLNNDAFVRLIEQNALQHAPDPTSVRSWSTYLDSHSRADMVAAYVGSAEVVAAQFGTQGLWLV